MKPLAKQALVNDGAMHMLLAISHLEEALDEFPNQQQQIQELVDKIESLLKFKSCAYVESKIVANRKIN